MADKVVFTNESLQTFVNESKSYTNKEIAALVNGAPETLNTIDELAAALDDNADILDVLNESIGNKADKTSLNSHTGNATTHVTATERTNWNAAKTHADSAHAPSNAEKNQNAFSNVKVGSVTVAADSTTDTLTLVAGSNVTLTPDATNDQIIIAATNTVYSHPNSGVTAGTYKSVTVNAAGHVTAGTNPTTLSGYGITDAAKSGHTHNYAGSASAGGSATSAVKLDTATAGSATQPVYFTGGKPVATTYTLSKSVPSNALFTDTNTKVTQTNSTGNADYRVVLSANANDTTETNTTLKSSNFRANPSTGSFRATKYNVADAVTLQYDSTNKCLNFVF